VNGIQYSFPEYALAGLYLEALADMELPISKLRSSQLAIRPHATTEEWGLLIHEVFITTDFHAWFKYTLCYLGGDELGQAELIEQLKQ